MASSQAGASNLASTSDPKTQPGGDLHGVGAWAKGKDDQAPQKAPTASDSKGQGSTMLQHWLAEKPRDEHWSPVQRT